MTTHTPATTRPQKAKALLAGGLVLGVGAAVTLAAWTDEAYVDATFGTNAFNIQVDAADGDGWVEAPEEAPSTLQFGLPLAENLTPGDTVFAPLSLRTDETSVSGTVTIEGATQAGDDVDPLFGALTYTVVALTDGATCDAAVVDAGADIVAPGLLTATSADGAIALAAGPDDEPGAPVDLCFAVTLPETADEPELQAQETTAVWEFSAVSADPEPTED